MAYRVVPSPTYRPSQFSLARRYDSLGDALRVMGEGMVVSDDGTLVAFHERHLPWLQAAYSTHTR